MTAVPPKTILAATDFSPAGNRALELAASIAPSGSRLILAHAIEPPEMPSPLYSHYVPEVAWSDARQKVDDEAQKALREVLSAEAVRGLTVEIQVRMGPVVKSLTDLADEVDADVVVVGNHGRNEFIKFFIGSVADRLVRQLGRPTLLVP